MEVMHITIKVEKYITKKKMPKIINLRDQSLVS